MKASKIKERKECEEDGLSVFWKKITTSIDFCSYDVERQYRKILQHATLVSTLDQSGFNITFHVFYAL
jgi:hypothetical protein